jgi:hypothetical protein
METNSTPAPSTLEDQARAAIAADGPQSVWWNVHKREPGGKETIAHKVFGLDFDEWEVGRIVGPGEFVRRLRFKGERHHRLQEVFHVAASIVPAPPSPSPTLTLAGPADDLASMVRELKDEVASLRREPARPASSPVGSIEVVKELAGLIGALAPMFKPTPLKDSLELLATVRSLAREESGGGGGGGGMDWSSIADAVLPHLLKSADATPQAPAARRVVKPATPAAATAPAPAPAPKTTGPDPLDALVMVLQIGAQSPNPDAGSYAVVLDDALRGAGVDVERLVDESAPGSLVSLLLAKRPDLKPAAAFLDMVEGKIRSDLYPPADPDAADPDNNDDAGGDGSPAAGPSPSLNGISLNGTAHP